MIELYVIGGALVYIGGGVATARWQHYKFYKERIHKPEDQIRREARIFGLVSWLWFWALIWPAIIALWPFWALVEYGILPGIEGVKKFITAPSQKLLDEKSKKKAEKKKTKVADNG